MEITQPLVSVVIPCYNAHKHLGQTLDSVRAQTYRNIEIIVIDDGSSDPITIDCLDQLDKSFRVVRQTNKGLPSARNAGFRAACGEYVLPLDADDWLERDAIECLIKALQENPQAAFAFSHLQLEGEGVGVLAKQYNFFEQLFLNQLPYCLLIGKASWQQLGGYDESMRKGYEDWEFNIRLGAHGLHGVVVPRPLFHYRISSTGMLLATSNTVHRELWLDIRQKHAALFDPISIYRLWRQWARYPSTYPLFLYFIWLLAANVLPAGGFSGLFRFARSYSHARRVTRAIRQLQAKSQIVCPANKTNCSGNRDERVVQGFGEEWSRFPQEALDETERSAIFEDYFRIFPWAELSTSAVGADVGCGSGRWADVVASRVGSLVCVDASAEALAVARRNLMKRGNVTFCQTDVGNLPFGDGELDFAYSLGVLHHVPDTGAAIAEVARTLKPGGLALIYLYYAFDNRPWWFRLLWRISDSLRWGISRLPKYVRFRVCDMIAALVYWPLARGAAVLQRCGFILDSFPLWYYRDKSFYVMRTDALDRFGTQLEKRFSQAQIQEMMIVAGFGAIRFNDAQPYWCVLGVKNDLSASKLN